VESLSAEDRRDPPVGLCGCQVADTGDDGRVRPPDIRREGRARDVERAHRLRLPTHPAVDASLAPRQRDVLDEEAQQLFARGLRRRGHLLDGRQVLRQGQDARAFLEAAQACGERRQVGILALQDLERGQFLVPPPFQRPRDQAVLWLDELCPSLPTSIERSR